MTKGTFAIPSSPLIGIAFVLFLLIFPAAARAEWCTCNCDESGTCSCGTVISLEVGVVSSLGRPVPGASVLAFDKTYDMSYRTVTTGSSGTAFFPSFYVLDDRNGDFEFEACVTAPGYVYSCGTLTAADTCQASQSLTVKVNPAAVPAPASLGVRPESDGTVMVSWQSGGSPTNGFLVKLVEGTTPGPCKSGTNVGNVASHLFSGLHPGTTYTASVCAYSNAGAYSAQKTASGQTLSESPSDATQLLASEIGQTAVELSWIPPSSADEFFQIAYQPGMTAPADCSHGAVVSSAVVQSATHYVVRGLSGSARYSFRVCGANGAGGLSSGISVTDPLPVSFPFSQTFNFGNSLVLGSYWTYQSDGFSVTSQEAIPWVPGQRNTITLNQLPTADVVASSRIAGMTLGSCLNLVSRYRGPGDSNMYTGGICQTAANEYAARIYKNVAGTWTLLSSGSVAGASGDLTFTTRSNSLLLTVSGLPILSATDSSLKTGTVGLEASGSGVAVTDFQADYAVPLLPPGSASLPFFDSFSRANASDLGVNWAAIVGGVGIADDRALGFGGSSVASAAIVNGASAQNVEVSADIDSNPGTCSGLIARYIGPGNTNYYLGEVCWNTAGASTAALYRNISGVVALVASVRAPAASGSLSFVADANRLTLSLDGTALLSHADSALAKPGSVGLGGSRGASYRNFKAVAAP